MASYNPLDKVYAQKNLVNNNRASMYAKPASNVVGRIEKSDEANELEKGGEGSKGGKIIGHTRSGKAIYDKIGHASYSNFDHKDHMDASNVHSSIGHVPSYETPLSREEANNHVHASWKHEDKFFEQHQSDKESGKEGVSEDAKESVDHGKKEADKYIAEANKNKDISSTIGKTKSGKDIKDYHNHPSHKDFTADDHIDAFYAHKGAADAVKDKVFAKHGGSTKTSRAELDDNMKHQYHSTTMQKHLDSYGAAKGIKKD